MVGAVERGARPVQTRRGWAGNACSRAQSRGPVRPRHQSRSARMASAGRTRKGQSMRVVEFLLAIIVVYYFVLFGLYALLIVLGAMRLRTYRLGVRFDEFRRIANSPLTMPFSVIIPAYNEELEMLNTVLSALRQRYPEHEVIVVNDGSKDR